MSTNYTPMQEARHAFWAALENLEEVSRKTGFSEDQFLRNVEEIFCDAGINVEITKGGE